MPRYYHTTRMFSPDTPPLKPVIFCDSCHMRRVSTPATTMRGRTDLCQACAEAYDARPPVQTKRRWWQRRPSHG